MKFTDTLKSLEVKATEGEITFSEYGNRNGAYQRLVARKSGIQKPWIGNINKESDAALIAYLRNHAKEIINLVEAAENVDVSSQGLYGQALVDALAALNKE